MLGLSLSRSDAFLLGTALAFVLPAAIPLVGLDFQYFFITVLVLSAWFLVKWNSVKKITDKGGSLELLAGLVLIGGDYLWNFLRSSNIGILDLIVIFLGVVIAFYGFRSLKLFWVPMTYGVVLLAGYQIEFYTPNYVALQDWLAGVMSSLVSALGIGTSTQGHVVAMTLPSGSPVFLDVASSCTGLQGILAFGLLSTMALLDLKPKLSRLIPLFIVGFVGAFLINIVRLLVVFLTYEFLGVDAGTTMHVYFGYVVFVAWVLVFWTFAFRILIPVKQGIAPGPPNSPPFPSEKGPPPGLP
jgi:exosortase